MKTLEEATTEDLAVELCARSKVAVVAWMSKDDVVNDRGFSYRARGSYPMRIWFMERIKMVLLHEERFHSDDDDGEESAWSSQL